MRNKLLQLFLLVGLTVGVTGLAQAQTGLIYRTNIPFDFTIGGESFKAGEYTIKFGYIQNQPASFLIASVDGKEFAVVNQTLSAGGAKRDEKARLVFEIDDHNYALTAVKSSLVNVEIFKSRRKQKFAEAEAPKVEAAMLRK